MTTLWPSLAFAAASLAFAADSFADAIRESVKPESLPLDQYASIPKTITAIDEMAYIHPADSSDMASKVIGLSRTVVITLLTFMGIPIVVWRSYVVVKRVRRTRDRLPQPTSIRSKPSVNK